MATADQEQGAHFVVGIGQRYDSVYLRSGTVTVEGFAIDYPLPPQGGSPPTSERRVAGDQPYVPPASTFTAVATGAAYDIGELAFSTYVQAVDLGKEITAIPVFPSRFFPHSQIQVHAGSGIRQPADLVGRRLAIGSFAKN